MSDSPAIFISAAEPSGDRHAASLIRAITQQCPSARFYGIAGPLMQAAGCECIEDFTQRSAMLTGAIAVAGHALRLVRRVGRLIRQRPTDLAIVVDSPALHLPMAKHIKPAGVPVLYYIAPQLWAWGGYRIGRVRRRVDRLAAILPFEEEFFCQRGVDARFVGHPLIEQLASVSPAPQVVQEIRAAGQSIIACLPGSRKHVIGEILPGQIEVARQVAVFHPRAVFVFAAASEQAAEMIRTALAGERFPFQIRVAQNAEVLEAADVALCASGTATLEVAFHRVPMVVMYNGSKIGYHLVARWLIRTQYLCLVNILANRQIVPEFMPYYTDTRPIADEVLNLLANPPRRQHMRQELDAIIQSLGSSPAAERAAMMALEMIAEQTRPSKHANIERV